MSKLNCWEFKKCGREPGGPKSAEFGACPVPLFKDFDRVHDGSHAGRTCWAVPASLCAGQQQGVFVQKLEKCQACEFFLNVKKEEESGKHGFVQTPAGIRIYLRSRGLCNPSTSSATSETGALTIGPDIIGDIERKYIFFAGHVGKKIIDSVFVDIRYRRGSGMSEKDFEYFLRMMFISLPKEQQPVFQDAAKGLGLSVVGVEQRMQTV